MKRQALLTILAKLKLAIIFFFYFSVVKTLAKSSQTCGQRRKTLKSWNAAISKDIQLVFCCVMEKPLIFYNFVSDIKRDIPQFYTVLLHSNWSNLRRRYLSKIPTDINANKPAQKISGFICPTPQPQKSSQHVRACAAGDGAICSKKRKIVPYS